MYLAWCWRGDEPATSHASRWPYCAGMYILACCSTTSQLVPHCVDGAYASKQVFSKCVWMHAHHACMWSRLGTGLQIGRIVLVWPCQPAVWKRLVWITALFVYRPATTHCPSAVGEHAYHACMSMLDAGRRLAASLQDVTVLATPLLDPCSIGFESGLAFAAMQCICTCLVPSGFFGLVNAVNGGCSYSFQGL